MGKKSNNSKYFHHDHITFFIIIHVSASMTQELLTYLSYIKPACMSQYSYSFLYWYSAFSVHTVEPGDPRTQIGITLTAQ